jgi:hypothetical protein
MARLFSCGFEENNLTETMWTSATAAIVATPVHSGSYALQVNPSSATESAIRNYASALTSGTLFVRVYFRIASLPVGATNAALLGSIGAGGTGAWIYLRNTSGVYTARVRNRITLVNADGTSSLSLNVWYRIEMRHLISDTVGQIEARLYTGDETTPLETWGIGAFSGGNGTDEDTLPTSVTRVVVGNTDSETFDYAVDDVAVNDTSGTFQTSWIGPSKFYLLVPNTEVSIGFTPNTGTDNSANVDDVPGAPDDDTTYNSSATADTEDRLGLTALGAEVPSDADIIAVYVYARIRGEGTTASRTCRVLLWDEGGAQTNGPTTPLNDSTAYRIMTTAEHLIYDASGKTKANIDSFDAGYEPLSNHATRVTALWVNVEWLEAAAGGGLVGPLVGGRLLHGGPLSGGVLVR